MTFSLPFSPIVNVAPCRINKDLTVVFSPAGGVGENGVPAGINTSSFSVGTIPYKLLLLLFQLVLTVPVHETSDILLFRRLVSIITTKVSLNPL